VRAVGVFSIDTIALYAITSDTITPNTITARGPAPRMPARSSLVKRTKVFPSGALLGALGMSVIALSAVAGAHGGHATIAARATKLGLRKTSLGTILASSAGRTLYEFTRDRPRTDTCMKIKECPESWPPLKTAGKPIAGPGVRASLLSAIRLPGGAMQVTYAGHALYLYAGDRGPGETSYVGEKAFGGRWYALDASGRTVR
jgi:predicted lipoprotein with Yx(FWY)xxD motif